jgi:aspartyl/asparaginyl-tRNA synthetase
VENGFFWVNTPIITASDAEGAAALLRVSTLDLANLAPPPRARVDFAQDFFGREAFLTVSGQLNVEAYCLALTKVYTFGPTFRAENSNTSRHLAEFWMIEPEWGADLQSEHERYLTEQYAKKPVIVMSYPKAIKAFYMRLNDDGRTVAAMDVLAPGIGQIIGGSQREERSSAASTASTTPGTTTCAAVPYAGFGIDFERTLAYATGLANVRDAIPFPRPPGTRGIEWPRRRPSSRR